MANRANIRAWSSRSLVIAMNLMFHMYRVPQGYNYIMAKASGSRRLSRSLHGAIDTRGKRQKPHMGATRLLSSPIERPQ